MTFLSDLPLAERRYYKPMATPPTPKQQIRKRISRNDPCPCGSGRKFKKCCLRDKGDDRFST